MEQTVDTVSKVLKYMRELIEKIFESETKYRVVGLFMFISLNLWYGLAVMALGFIPLSTGLLGACPTIPLMH